MTRSSVQLRLLSLVAPRIHYRMTDKNMEHPTQGRRRRHKSPSSVQSAPLLPVPRLADYLDTDVGPSDEEGGKEAKPDTGHVSGTSHGGIGSSSLQECLDRLNQARNNTPERRFVQPAAGCEPKCGRRTDP